MNYYQPREISDADGKPTGTWRYTVRNDDRIWAVGYCAESLVARPISGLPAASTNDVGNVPLTGSVDTRDFSLRLALKVAFADVINVSPGQDSVSVVLTGEVGKSSSILPVLRIGGLIPEVEVNQPIAGRIVAMVADELARWDWPVSGLPDNAVDHHPTAGAVLYAAVPPPDSRSLPFEAWPQIPLDAHGIELYHTRCPGHDTPDEARAHYREYLLDQTFRIEEYSHYEPCAVCGVLTNKRAGVDHMMPSWSLCDEHATREAVAERYTGPGDMVSSW